MFFQKVLKKKKKLRERKSREKFQQSFPLAGETFGPAFAKVRDAEGKVSQSLAKVLPPIFFPFPRAEIDVLGCAPALWLRCFKLLDVRDFFSF